MFTFLVIVTILVFLALLVVGGMKPAHSSLSLFELKRQAKHSAAAKKALVRQQSLASVEGLLSLFGNVLLAALVIMPIVTFGWALGVIIGVFLAASHSPLSRLQTVSSMASRFYAKVEPQLLKLVHKFPKTTQFFEDTPITKDHQVFSKQEFQELIDRSGTALTSIERKVIINALDFNEKLVSSIMTPRSSIDFINKGEFLGPLVLDELHAMGHSCLPVVNKDLDHVVGILYLRDMLSLDIKRSATAEKAMDSKVYYIRHDQTLEHALAAFLKHHHHLLIVINKHRETVGMLTIEDTVEALLGRKILDEDDDHGDVESVANHQATRPHVASDSTDV
jgi:CBS domain containing-hemolysin-like protein